MKGLRWLVLVVTLVVLASLGVSASAAAKKTTLEFFHLTWMPQAKEALNQAIAEFEKQNPDIEIKQTIVSWGEAHSMFMTSLVAGVAPDIAQIGGPWAPAFALLKAFAELDQLAPKGFEDMFIPAGLAALKMDGHLYGLPWEGATWGFFYRKDLFAQAGLDPNKPPRNWDELLDCAKALTKDRNKDGKTDQWGLGFPCAGWEPADYYLPFLWQAGGDVCSQGKDGKWKATINGDAGRKATNFYVDLVRTHKVTPETVAGMDWENVKNGFAAGDIAMMFNGMWVVSVLNDTAPDIKGKWATAVNPAGPTGVKAALGYPNTIHITRQSKNKEAAWKFLEFFYTGNPSWADRYAIETGSLNWTKDFVKLPYAKDLFLKPFVESMEFGHYPPLAPKYEDFRQRVFNPGLQGLVLGKESVADALARFEVEFNKLH